MHRFVIPARLFDEMNLIHPLEVLEVLAGGPVATPLEAGGGEEPNLVERGASSILVCSRIQLKGLQIAGKTEIVDTAKIV